MSVNNTIVDMIHFDVIKLRVDVNKYMWKNPTFLIHIDWFTPTNTFRETSHMQLTSAWITSKQLHPGGTIGKEAYVTTKLMSVSNCDF